MTELSIQPLSSPRSSVMTAMGRVMGRGRAMREGIYVCIQLIHFVEEQKVMQCLKAIILL